MKYFVISFAALLFTGCSIPEFKFLKPDQPTQITLEEKYFKPLFGTSSEFDLRITNNSNTDLKNCELIFDDKYKHSLQGLHSRNKGLIRDSLFRKGSQYVIYFDREDSNLEFFNVGNDFTRPEKISLKCDECLLYWETD